MALKYPENTANPTKAPAPTPQQQPAALAITASLSHWMHSADPRYAYHGGLIASCDGHSSKGEVEAGPFPATPGRLQLGTSVGRWLAPTAPASDDTALAMLAQFRPLPPQHVALRTFQPFTSLPSTSHPAFSTLASSPLPSPCRCILHLQTTYNDQALRCIIDTGASVNLISQRFITPLHTLVKVPVFEIKDVNGRVQQLDTRVALTLDFAGSPYSFDFYLSRLLPADAILGLEAIIESGWLIDAIHRQLLHVYHALPPLPLAPCSHRALLAYTATATTLPPRTWTRIVVCNPHVRYTPPHLTTLACTPTFPPVLPLHGASSLVPAHTPYLPLPPLQLWLCSCPAAGGSPCCLPCDMSNSRYRHSLRLSFGFVGGGGAKGAE